MLKTGDKAPLFTLKDEKGNEVSLSDFKGHKVVLYFYPKDNTPGCTRQALAYKEYYNALRELDTYVIAISKDPINSHLKFKDKYALPFILLSDPEHEVIEAYGAWQEKKIYGKVSMGTIRSAFIIDEEGTVIKAMPKVRPDDNALEVLEFIKEYKENK